MKSESDFDALLAGVPAEEVRRLHKLLTTWSRGDENGFPVQLALLTRAQFRANANVPRLMEEQLQKMNEDLETLRRSILSAAAGTQDTFKHQLAKLESEVTRHGTALREAGGDVSFKVREAQGVVRDIKETFAEGKRSLEWVHGRLTQEGDNLTKVVAEIGGALKDERSMSKLLAALLIFAVAFGLGYYVAHREYRPRHTTATPAQLINP